MSVTVGTLIIDLQARTASFSGEMGKMSQLAAKSANDIKRSLEKVTVAAAAMATALIVSTAGVVRSALDQVDALGKAAQAAGTTAETLSTLEYAAKLSNVENEQLVKGLEKLSLAAFKAQGGNVQLEKIFGRLGVTIMDANGHLKDSGILLEEMAPKFSAMADGAGKTALAQAIFGKAGASLIPMLNQYGEEQARVNDEAHRFGLVLSQSTVDIAMKAHDNLDRLTSVLKGMGFSLLAATLPALDSLLQKLINIAQTSDLQGLAKKFGGEVTKAVNMLGDALDFAVKHATALKIALEAIAAVKIASIAIPIVADLAGGGLANVGAGIDKATLGMLGLQRAANALPTISAKIGGIASGFYKVAEGATVAEVAAKGMSVGFGGIATRAAATTGALRTLAVGFGAVAAEEGILSATTFTLGTALTTLGGRFLVSLRAIPALLGSIAAGAANVGKAMLLAALSNPWTAAALAIAGAVAALYTFRDATFSLGGSTYELRDTWNAAWILMKEATAKVVDWFKTAMQDIKDAWSGVVDWIKSNPITGTVFDHLSDANERLKKDMSWLANKIIPGGFVRALDEAKRRRIAAGIPEGYTTGDGTQDLKQVKPPPDTSGLGKPQKDIFGDEIRKLDEAIAAQRAYLAVIDGTPDAIQAATAAEKAHAVIVELNNKLTDEGRANLTAKQQAMIVDRVTTEESVKALVDYGRELVSQQHSTDLSIQQARAMSLAQMQGDEAVRQAAIDNAILALTYNKTAEQLSRMVPELAKLRDLLTVKSNADLIEGVNRQIFAIDQEVASQRILQGAMLGTIATQRQAEIEAKTYALNQQIAAAANEQVRASLIHQRDAMVEQMRLQQQSSDLAEARNTLGGPADQFEQEKEHLRDLVYALAQAQKGQLTYAQQVEAAAAYQDIFDKMIDKTVQSMIRFGDARDGVNAFFLDMQKQAQSTASIVYDAMHSAFDKISENLAQLVTGGKTSFAKMFEDIGRSIVQADIKKYLQEGLARLAPHIPGLSDILGKETTKNDGASEQTALWVQLTSANSAAFAAVGRSTNELTPLIGPNPQPQEQAFSAANQIAQHPPVNIGSALSDLPSFLKILGGLGGQKSPFGESLGLPKGNELTDLLGPIAQGSGDESEQGLPTDEGAGDEQGGGILSAITGVIGGLKNGMQSQGTPNGTAANPLYVKMISAAAAATGAAGGLDVLSDIFGGGAKGTQSNPVYVKNAGGEGSGLGDILGGFGGSDSSGDNSDGSDSSGGGGFLSSLGSIFSSLFGGKSSGGDSGDSGGGLIPHAEGGPVTPSSAYLVGEKGPEILTGVSGNITSHANSMRALSSSSAGDVYYSIDARGTDPVLTEQRTRAGIMAAHNSAINKSAQLSAERMKRLPQRY